MDADKFENFKREMRFGLADLDTLQILEIIKDINTMIDYHAGILENLQRSKRMAGEGITWNPNT